MLIESERYRVTTRGLLGSLTEAFRTAHPGIKLLRLILIYQSSE
jgi:hypothetical protein